MWLNELFASGPLQIRSPDDAHAQIFAMTNHWMQLYTLVLKWCLKDVKLTYLFYFDLSEKQFCQNILRSKDFKKNHIITWCKRKRSGWMRKRFKNCRYHILDIKPRIHRLCAQKQAHVSHWVHWLTWKWLLNFSVLHSSFKVVMF